MIFSTLISSAQNFHAWRYAFMDICLQVPCMHICASKFLLQISFPQQSPGRALSCDHSCSHACLPARDHAGKFFRSDFFPAAVQAQPYYFPRSFNSQTGPNAPSNLPSILLNYFLSNLKTNSGFFSLKLLVVPDKRWALRDKNSYYNAET